MPNCMLDLASFKSKLKGMTPEEREDFLFEVLYRLDLQCPEHRKQTSLNTRAIIVIYLVLAGAGLLTVAGIPVLKAFGG